MAWDRDKVCTSLIQVITLLAVASYAEWVPYPLPYVNLCRSIGECSQICKRNTSECDCIIGYTLDVDGKSCLPDDPRHKIFFAGGNKLGFIDVDENGKEETKILFPWPHAAYTNFEFMTYDARNEVIFWTDNRGREGVYRSSIRGHALPQTVYNGTLKKPRGIAFDWITGNLYFTDYGLHKIFVCRSDIFNLCTFIRLFQSSHPYGIALLPNFGIMFWTDWSSNTPGIFRAGMDGRYETALVTTNIIQPSGIAVDQGSGRMYWIDRAPNGIFSADFNGANRKTIRLVDSRCLGIDVYGDRVFYGFWLAGELQSANKFSGTENTTRQIPSIGSLQGVTVFSTSNQPAYLNDLCKNNAKCPYMCALTYSAINSTIGYSCLCPEGMTYIPPSRFGACVKYFSCDSLLCLSAKFQFAQENGVSKLGEVFIMLGNNIAIASINPDEGNLQVSRRFQFTRANEMEQVAYNLLNDALLFSDSESILQYDFGSKFEVLVETGLSKATSLVVDNTGGNIYWIGNGSRSVIMMSLRTRRTLTLLESSTTLCGLLVVPEEESLLLVGKGNSSGVDIYKYTLDGSRLQSVYNLPVQGKCTTLGYDGNGLLLWTGAHGNSIEATRILPEGFSEKSQTVVLRANPNVSANSSSIVPGSLVMLDGVLIWVDSITQELKQYSNGSVRLGIRSTRFLSDDEFQNKIGTKAKLTVVGKVAPLCNLKRCAHICLASGECKCATGYTIQKDGRSCAVEETEAAQFDHKKPDDQDKGREQTCTRRICGHLYRECEFSQESLDHEAAALFLSRLKPVVHVITRVNTTTTEAP